MLYGASNYAWTSWGDEDVMASIRGVTAKLKELRRPTLRAVFATPAGIGALNRQLREVPADAWPSWNRGVFNRFDSVPVTECPTPLDCLLSALAVEALDPMRGAAVVTGDAVWLTPNIRPNAV
jgi:hypothetical protein